MEYSFYAIHWIQFENQKIKWTDDSLFYTYNKTSDVEEMKNYVRSHVLKNHTADLTIQNISKISRAQFEEYGGNILN
jgi:hypothetical protein